MLPFLAIVVFLLFMGLGFVSHMLWLGGIASVLLLIAHMVRHGLAGRTPTSRLNIALIRAFSGFLDDVVEARASEAREMSHAEPVTEVGAGTNADTGADQVAEAEIVEDGNLPVRAAAAVVHRSEVRAAVAERAAHWRAMTPNKLAEAEEMAADGVSRAEIARKLGVSRSTISRHLSGKVP